MNWATDGITLKDIQPYILPDEKKLKNNKTVAYFFGYFEDWNVNHNYKYIKSKMDFLVIQMANRLELILISTV